MEKNNNNDARFQLESNKGKYAQDTVNEKVSKRTLVLVIFGFVVVIAAGLTFAAVKNGKNLERLSSAELQNEAFEKQLVVRDSVINEWIMTFNQIEQNLDTIRQRENLLAVESSGMEFNQEKKQQIIEDIRYIHTLLDQNKSRIASLSAQLRNSGITIKGLEDKVAELETTLAATEVQMEDLKLALSEKDIEIDSLNIKMGDMEYVIAEQYDRINSQTDEMNTAYVVSSTFKDLKEKGIVDREGGFLGLGSKKSLKDDFADSSFIQINVLETKEIPVDSKEVQLITEHPSDSYELVRGGDKIAYIEITDPDEFWKISNYAVVEIDGK